MLKITMFTAALFLGAAAAQAETANIVHVSVSYADLNIHSKAGARVLLGRLQQAARTACGGQPAISDLTESQNYQACRRQALDHAVAGIASPELVALYNGQPAPALVASK